MSTGEKQNAAGSQEKITIHMNSTAYSNIMPHIQQTKIVCAINCRACKKKHIASQHAYIFVRQERKKMFPVKWRMPR